MRLLVHRPWLLEIRDPIKFQYLYQGAPFLTLVAPRWTPVSYRRVVAWGFSNSLCHGGEQANHSAHPTKFIALARGPFFVSMRTDSSARSVRLLS